MSKRKEFLIMDEYGDRCVRSISTFDIKDNCLIDACMGALAEMPGVTELQIFEHVADFVANPCIKEI